MNWGSRYQSSITACNSLFVILLVVTEQEVFTLGCANLKRFHVTMHLLDLNSSKVLDVVIQGEPAIIR